ncbi:MAG: hypothetical protein KBA15_04515 [Spirochaetes bacterium]|jgi:hypothetical protein|nr:hypothetical protein [Spirochaetota bacterium]
MKKIAAVIVPVAMVVLLAAGCSSKGSSRGDMAMDVFNRVSSFNTDSITSKKSDSDAPASKKGYETPGADGSDAHYIQPDDYFISKEPLGTRTWIWVTLAKVVTAPSAATKYEGQFMAVHDGKEMWTKSYWKTRIGTKADIRLGAVIIAFDGNQQDDVYQPPKNKKEARNEGWYMAKITDTSDLYKGYVMVSGGYRVSVDNIRIAVK